MMFICMEYKFLISNCEGFQPTINADNEDSLAKGSFMNEVWILGGQKRRVANGIRNGK